MKIKDLNIWEEKCICFLPHNKHSCADQGHSNFTASFCAYFPSTQGAAWEDSGMSQFDSDFLVVFCHYHSWKEEIHSSLGVASYHMKGYMGEAAVY